MSSKLVTKGAVKTNGKLVIQNRDLLIQKREAPQQR